MDLSLSSTVKLNLSKSKYTGVLWRFTLYLIPSVILGLAGLMLFASAGRDDAHITYWSAHTLAQFGQILNYNGDRIEQSSSLLQVILLAALVKITGLNIVAVAKISSILAGVASVVAIFKLAMKMAADRAVGFSAAIITAASAYFIYWSYGGMESTLVSLTGICLILFVADYLGDRAKPSLVWPTVAIILFELVRPESPILLGCLLGGAIAVVLLKGVFSGKELKATHIALLFRMLILFGIYTIISLALFAFREWYFGSLFPQPVTAKSDGFSLTALAAGFKYVTSSWSKPPEMVLAFAMAAGVFHALVVQLRAREINLYILFSLLYVAGYFSFVLFSGGDWMEGARFYVYFLPVLIAFIPLAIMRMTKSKIPLIVVTTLLVVVEAMSLIDFAQHSSTGIPFWSSAKITSIYDTTQYSWFETHSRINMRDVPVIQRLNYVVTQIANHRQGSPVVIMSGQMGMVAYYISMEHFGGVRFIDRYGLADRTFTDCMVAKQLPRTSAGIKITYYEQYLAMQQICHIADPDIIFDGGDALRMGMEEHGYTVIYSQAGVVTTDDTWLKGVVVKADEFIAIRTPLLGLLDDAKPVHVLFSN